MLGIRRGVAAIGMAALLGAPLACNGSENCVDKQCTCEGSSCDFECAGGSSCQYDCGSGQDCSGNCPEGSCQMTCTGSESCVLDCPGGGCQLTCTSGTGRCVITGCHSACQLTCNGAPTCESSCTPLDGGCQTTP